MTAVLLPVPLQLLLLVLLLLLSTLLQLLLLPLAVLAAVPCEPLPFSVAAVRPRQRERGLERSFLAVPLSDEVELVLVANLADFSAVPVDQRQVVLLLSLLPRSQCLSRILVSLHPLSALPQMLTFRNLTSPWRLPPCCRLPAEVSMTERLAPLSWRALVPCSEKLLT